MSTTSAPDTPVPPSAVAYDSPVGPLTVVATADGVRAVLWPVDGEAQRTGLATVELDEPGAGTAVAIVLDRAVEQLDEYFAGLRTEFDLPLDPVGTEFQRSAWHALTTIGFAETVSYSEQAERMGDRSKARAVGAANGKNPISIIVPCHRVVGSDGSLTGFAGGTETKRWLLDHEARVAGTRLV